MRWAAWSCSCRFSASPCDGRNGFRDGPGLFQPGRHAVIGQLGLVMHPGPVQAGAFHRPIRIDQHLDDNGEAVFIEIQGSDIGGDFFRQHREYFGGGIDRGGVMAGMLVQRRAVRYGRVHICNGNQHLDLVAGHGLGHAQLVQVARSHRCRWSTTAGCAGRARPAARRRFWLAPGADPARPGQPGKNPAASHAGA